MPDKKVLITGGAGFIGSHIIDKLLDNNYQVICVDNLSTGDIKNLPNNKNLKFFNKDIAKNDLEDIFKTEKPQYIIHLAAQTSVNYSIKNTYFDAEMNIMATIKLLNLCQKYKIKKFLTASSAAVYGNPKYLPIDENHPTEPMSPYGLSKLTMEKYIQLSNVPYIIFRFSNAYGPRQKSSKESGVIAIFDNAMKNNEQVCIYGNGEQIRDFIYVEDIARICVKAIKSDIKNEILNVSTNTSCTINELFRAMAKVYSYKKEPIYRESRIGDIKESILDNKKLKRLPKIGKLTSSYVGLNNLYNYSKANSAVCG